MVGNEVEEVELVLEGDLTVAFEHTCLSATLNSAEPGDALPSEQEPSKLSPPHAQPVAG